MFICKMNVFCSLNERQTDQVSYISDAYWNRESSHKKSETRKSPKLQTEKHTYCTDISYPKIASLPLKNM